MTKFLRNHQKSKFDLYLKKIKNKKITDDKMQAKNIECVDDKIEGHRKSVDDRIGVAGKMKTIE